MRVFLGSLILSLSLVFFSCVTRVEQQLPLPESAETVLAGLSNKKITVAEVGLQNKNASPGDISWINSAEEKDSTNLQLHSEILKWSVSFDSLYTATLQSGISEEKGYWRIENASQSQSRDSIFLLLTVLKEDRLSPQGEKIRISLPYQILGFTEKELWLVLPRRVKEQAVVTRMNIVNK